MKSSEISEIMTESSHLSRAKRGALTIGAAGQRG